MRKHLDLEMLCIPLLFVSLLAFLASKRIGWLGGPLLAPPMMLLMAVPLFVRSSDDVRRQHRLSYLVINLGAIAAVCVLIWSLRTAVLAAAGV